MTILAETVKITIETGNAAFHDGPPHALTAGFEIARILRRMADEFEKSGSSGNPRDVNGNTVGSIVIHPTRKAVS